MAFTFQNIRDGVKSKLSDVGNFATQSDIDECINSALRHINHDKPLFKVLDLVGDGSADYELGTLFKRGFSIIDSVETPAGKNPPVLRDPDDDWFIYDDPIKIESEKLRLRFRFINPSAGVTIVSLADLDSVLFQSGNIVRYTFAGTPDLSGLAVGQSLTVTGAVNTENNGSFPISSFNDANDTIDVVNLNRTDNVKDEASNTTGTGIVKDSDLIRVILSTPYDVTVGTNAKSNLTNPDTFQAVVYKSLVLILRSLANRFNQSLDPTLEADSVDYAGRAQGFLFVAERFEKNYKDLVNIGKDIKAAHAFAEADIVFANGEDFIWHPARTR